MGEAFAHLGAFRMLPGEAPDVDYAQVATLDLRRHFRRALAGELGALDFIPDHTRLVDSLLAFLERDTVAMRHLHCAPPHVATSRGAWRG